MSLITAFPSRRTLGFEQQVLLHKSKLFIFRYLNTTVLVVAAGVLTFVTPKRKSRFLELLSLCLVGCSLDTLDYLFRIRNAISLGVSVDKTLLSVWSTGFLGGF